MAQEIVQHGHCQVCGRVVKYGEATCSDKCKGDVEKTRRTRRRTMIMMYALMAILFLVLILPQVLRGGA